MYNNNMSRETITQMAKATEKARKLEKSQAELRVVLEQKLITLKPSARYPSSVAVIFKTPVALLSEMPK